MSAEFQLHDAVESNRVSEIASFLRDHPELDVDVNIEEYIIRVPDGPVLPELYEIANRRFVLSVINDTQEVAMRFLREPWIFIDRVPTGGMSSALKHAFIYQRSEIFMAFIALRPHQITSWLCLDEFKTIKIVDDLLIFHLLEIFQVDPHYWSSHYRREVGLLNEEAAGHYAHIIFHCDELLRLKKSTTIWKKCMKKYNFKLSERDTKSTRFLEITRRLPMEIQMIVCLRAVGSAKDIIPHKVSEHAFQMLAQHCVTINKDFVEIV